ncbi:transaldolase [Ignatzschineria rhizosphaerae]|uniref:Transaldolase n=1 Tax=Ignatzschineria rhizosphaerae TaxID=2923279 RepID=A0ABY3X1A4_9GAMM|nr:transaldolase [Ignatzschineria rhizosphaerae]UNM96614.1 transaldolase [Ignatzschineria rhizosphaerae]
MGNIRKAQALGQSIWFDNIERNMLGNEGKLAQMIVKEGLLGITSNPAIFEKAIAGGVEYLSVMKDEANQELSARELFFKLAIDDIQTACDLFADTYEATDYRDGYVSLEVSPDLAHDANGTIIEAKALWEEVDRPNLMIKVPATKAGIIAIEALIAEGINVNVTLIFSVSRYEKVLDAFLKGLEARVKQGLPISKIASVASFFISRIDSVIDAKVSDIAPELKGHIAIDNAKMAYEHYQFVMTRDRAKALLKEGMQPQRLLWASTGVKDPSYSETLYVYQLMGADTVNTIPPKTYYAFLEDKTVPTPEILTEIEASKTRLKTLKELGIDLNAVCEDLETAGVEQFVMAFDSLLSTIEKARH